MSSLTLFCFVLLGEKLVSNPNYPKKNQYSVFVWRIKTKDGDLIITTANNPVTGEYSIAGGRGDEEDYASYMDIQGPSELVQQAIDLIHEHADQIKDEEEGGGFTAPPFATSLSSR